LRVLLQRPTQYLIDSLLKDGYTMEDYNNMFTKIKQVLNVITYQFMHVIPSNTPKNSTWTYGCDFIIDDKLKP